LAAPGLRGFDDENRWPKSSPVGRADNGQFCAFDVDLQEIHMTVKGVRGDDVVERVARHPYRFNRWLVEGFNGGLLDAGHPSIAHVFSKLDGSMAVENSHTEVDVPRRGGSELIENRSRFNVYAGPSAIVEDLRH